MASVNLSEISYLEATPSTSKGQGQIFIDQGTVQYYYQSSGGSSEPITIVNQTTENGSLQNVTSQGNSQVVISTETSYPDFAIVPTEANTSESCYVLIVQSPEKSKESLISAQNVYEFNNDDDVDFGSFAEEDGPTKARLTKRSQTASKAVMCTYCSYTTSKKYLLSRHMKTHSEERPHKCSVCERGFKTLASLQNHVNTHTGTKPHPCKFCESTFTTSGELVRHIRYRHTHEKPHQCTLCDYSSVELSKLKRHLRCHTNERPFQCPHCSYASPDAFKLKRHLRIHTGEKPYECDVCHAKFTQSNSLKSHRTIHTGLKPVFKCDLCPTTCGRRTDLRMHMQKLHSAGAPVQCKLCSKTLPDRYTLKVHRKEVHDGKANFACTLCPYKSMSQRHLEAHMFIHTDEKPYQCHACDQSFRQPQLLKRHVNLHHDPNYLPAPPKEKIHVCPKCSKSFRHKGNMLRHIAQHDPSTNAQLQQEALSLKLGRQKRVHSFGETQFVVEEEAYEECDEDEEFANAGILNTENGPQKFIVETDKSKTTTIEFSAVSIEPLVKSPKNQQKQKQSKKRKRDIQEITLQLEPSTSNDINNCFGFDDDDVNDTSPSEKDS